jgi:hypothetical protein
MAEFGKLLVLFGAIPIIAGLAAYELMERIAALHGRKKRNA